jgi:outer membrane protein TolC
MIDCKACVVLFVLVLFALAVSCGAGVASAETPLPAPLRLAEVVQRALANNPGFAAARFEAEAARAKADKVGALPNPMLSFGVMDRAEGGDWPDTEEKRLMLEQKFPWFGKRGLQKNVADREAEGASHTVDAARLVLKRRVQETFFELHAVRQSIAITREEEKVLLDIAEIARSLYATGGRSQGDVFGAESETTLIKQKTIELEAREKTLVAELNVLLDRKADTPVGALAPPPEVRVPDDLPARLAVASISRPAVLYARTMGDR